MTYRYLSPDKYTGSLHMTSVSSLHAFALVVPHAWNALPSHVNLLVSLASSEIHLKSHLL